MRMIFSCVLRKVWNFRATSLLTTLALLGSGVFAQSVVSLTGRITDPMNSLVVGAELTLTDPFGFKHKAIADIDGIYRFDGLTEGPHTVSVTASGFATTTRTVVLRSGVENVDLRLDLAALAQHAAVASTRIAEAAETIAGSVSVLDAKSIESSRVFTTNEALRKIAGVHTRDEEGFGLRPNIGIRGINPTRSTKVLLLEDGIPLSYAPYGDNASYYHPPIERFASVEVLKGAGQILYGPATVSGVVNYLTPTPPVVPSGSVTLIGGTPNYLNGRFNWGGTWDGVGFLLDAARKQGEGSRENQRFGLNDISLKAMTALGGNQMLTLKGSYYGERSNVTYSGLREAEYRENPRSNPFANDFFYGDRWGASAIHSVAVGAQATIATSAYVSRFERDWWRQSSNSNERPNDRSNPACSMASLNTVCGNQGRLRNYTTWGVEPRLRVRSGLFGTRSDAELGFRLHFEHQGRRQENGRTPAARSGQLVEDNVRRNRAYSAFLQNRFQIGRLAITPGFRVERIAFERHNRLGPNGGVRGRTALTEVVPGIGASFEITPGFQTFGGVHRGFAPPRTEDIISNATGASIDLDPERSWNYEAGIRVQAARTVSIEATAFAMDYEHQLVPASVAGGLGAVLTNGGATLHQGFEVAGRMDTGAMLGSRHNLYVRAAVTHIPVARFSGVRFSSVPGFDKVSVSGNRLPYAPRNLVNVTVGYVHPLGLETIAESVVTGPQWADDLNTIDATPDGQRGKIPVQSIVNATINYPLESFGSTFFVSVKNVFDRTFIVDRSRGILPSSSRLIHAGLKFQF